MVGRSRTRTVGRTCLLEVRREQGEGEVGRLEALFLSSVGSVIIGIGER